MKKYLEGSEEYFTVKRAKNIIAQVRCTQFAEGGMFHDAAPVELETILNSSNVEEVTKIDIELMCDLGYLSIVYDYSDHDYGCMTMVDVTSKGLNFIK